MFCGHTASTRSSYKISRVGSSRAHCSPRGVPGRCGWDERALQVSGGLSGLEGGGRDEDAPIATLTAGVAAVRCARCPAGRLLPCPARRPSSGATPRRDPILRSAAGCSTTPAFSHLLATRVSWAAPRSAFKVSRGTLSRRMLRSCVWFLRLRSQTGSCCLRIRYPLVFSGPLRPSYPTPFLFALLSLLPSLFSPSLFFPFPYSSFISVLFDSLHLVYAYFRIRKTRMLLVIGMYLCRTHLRKTRLGPRLGGSVS